MAKRKPNGEGLICHERKTCEYCQKSYGRKVRRPEMGGTPYLQAMSGFKRSRTCSERCKYRLASREAREKVKGLEQTKAAQAAAIDAFLYAPRLSL
jgi:hypothetical protein